MRDNPIQFAVVREDHLIEQEVLSRYPAKRPFMIASGGCSALTLQAIFPDAEFTLLDPNPAQLDHVRAKMNAMHNASGTQRNADFNIEHSDPMGLSECGNFESLFRGLRVFLHDLVLPYQGWRRYFSKPGAIRDIRKTVFDHPYWAAAFEMYFCDPLLEAMFGPDATQHAEPRSYPGYFRAVFERGLELDTAFDNSFLHHVFLGHYLDRPACLPGYLSMQPADYRFHFEKGYVDDTVDLGAHEFVGLSNIFDWMAPASVDLLLEKVSRELQPGTVIMWRQLNNRRDLESRLRHAFDFDPAWCRSLQERDRSLFYTSIHVGVRAAGGKR